MSDFPNNNSVSVTRRHQHPAVNERTFLELYFSKNGAYLDPNEVKSVHIFQDDISTSNGDAGYFIDASGLVNANYEKDALFIFSGAGVQETFTGGVLDSSGIFNLSGISGYLGVVLTPTAQYMDASGNIKTNTLTANGSYFDIWTLKKGPHLNFTTYPHSFTMSDKNVITFTEPINYTVSHRVSQRYGNVGSVMQVDCLVDISIINQNIDDETKNIIEDTIVNDADVRILKINHEMSGDPFTEIRAWGDSGVNITSMNTIQLLWDTSALTSGDYQIQIRHRLHSEYVYSDKFTIILK